MKRILSLLLVSALLLNVPAGCKKDKGTPPVLPPANTMIIDFSNFEPKTKGANDDSFPKGSQISNWEFAAGAAMLWKAIIWTTLAVPVYSFDQITEKSPVYVDDNTWEWNTTATILNTTYKARLTGQIMESTVQWKMYISKEGSGSFTDFLWFSGTSDLNGTSGEWVLYESNQNPVEILRIDWSKTASEIGSVTYTFTKNGNPLKDSYITYGLTSNTLNAYYEISYYNTSFQQVFELEVEWSTSQHNGRVRCPAHFENDDWYCWDSNFANIECP